MQYNNKITFRFAALVSAENWVDICTESSGNKCCAKDDTGKANILTNISISFQ